MAVALPRSFPNALSAQVARVRPSLIFGLQAKAGARAAAGRDVFFFGAGEPDFDTPTHIREATKPALDGGFTH
jgi:aspartate aminotransferase